MCQIQPEPIVRHKCVIPDNFLQTVYCLRTIHVIYAFPKNIIGMLTIDIKRGCTAHKYWPVSHVIPGLSIYAQEPRK